MFSMSASFHVGFFNALNVMSYVINCINTCHVIEIQDVTLILKYVFIIQFELDFAPFGTKLCKTNIHILKTHTNAFREEGFDLLVLWKFVTRAL